MILSQKNESFNKNEVRRHCLKYLADYQQPRKYFLIDKLPKSGVGKTMKKLLPEYCISTEI